MWGSDASAGNLKGTSAAGLRRPADVTTLLGAIARDEPGSADRLYSAVARELRRLAEWRLAGARPGEALRTTELVNEAYLRMFGNAESRWEDRRHFYFAAARAMRDIFVEQVRRLAAQKRGGDRRRVEFDIDAHPAADDGGIILDVHQALDQLRAHDDGCADIVLLRFFGGLTQEETGRALGLPLARVRRDWEYARAWLRRHLER